MGNPFQEITPTIRILHSRGAGIRFNPMGPGTYMGGCQNYGPLLGPLSSRCRIN